MRFLAVKKVDHYPFWLGCVNRGQEIAVACQDSCVGNEVLRCQQNQVYPHLNVYTLLLKNGFPLSIKTAVCRLSQSHLKSWNLI